MADYIESGLRKVGVTLSKPVLAAICIVFGILVILLPGLLVWFVGTFLIFQGALLFTDLLELGKMGTKVAQGFAYCSGCGAGNTKEAVYCWKCGEELKLVNQREFEGHKETAIAVAP